MFCQKLIKGEREKDGAWEEERKWEEGTIIMFIALYLQITLTLLKTKNHKNKIKKENYFYLRSFLTVISIWYIIN